MTSIPIRNTQETFWTLFLKQVTMSSQQLTDHIKHNTANRNSGYEPIVFKPSEVFTLITTPIALFYL